MKPADAVKHLLSSHPHGLTRKEVIRELADKIDTDSNDRRRLLYNTVFNLVKRKTLREVGDRVMLAEGSEMS